MTNAASGLFGTDGIRGEAGKFPLDPRTVYLVGRALVETGRQRFVTGRDTRRSGIWLSAMLNQGIESAGGTVVSAGVIPTPGIAYLAAQEDFDAGIVISASHNPYRDNGIKVIGKDGVKLPVADEDHISESVLQASREVGLPKTDPTQAYEPLTFANDELIASYIHFLTSASKSGLEGLKVYLDCANGAAYRIAPRVFQNLGAEVLVANTDPDGTNINAECGALYAEQLAALVARSEVDFGAAFDGDADRLILIDEKGKVVDGDRILFILSTWLLSEGRLPTQAVVGTVMSNSGLEQVLAEMDLTLIRTAVGDRYVLEAMLEQGHGLGGEPSGHVIVSELSYAGDGILTALLVAEVIRECGLALSKLHEDFPAFPQVLVNVPVKYKEDLAELPEISRQIKRAEEELSESGRVLVRYSGTESLVRIMLEGKDHSKIERLAADIAAAVKKSLG